MFKLRENLLVVAIVVAMGIATGAEAALQNIAPSGVASQSSTLAAQYSADKANNGVLGDFSHTLETNIDPTWELLFPMNAAIESIVIHNRDSCCGSRLRDITVDILDVNGIDVLYTSALLNAENTGFTFPAGPDNIALDLVALTGGAVNGGLVRITRTSDLDLSGTGGQGNSGEASVLSLGEVQVFSETIFPYNLALGKPATQSTNQNASLYPASRATDGILNNTNFTHTLASNDPDPTLSVTLGRSSIDEIILHNRIGCCPERLRDITVSIEDDFGNEVFNSGLLNSGNTLGGPPTLSLDLEALTGGSVVGSKVVVKRTPDGAGDQYVLSLAELQAIGLPVENIALNKPASQSTGYLGDTYPATNATNGNLGDFTHTSDVEDAAPTLTVDLLELFEIDELFIHNRLGCCGGRLRDITVEILDDAMQVVFTSDVLNPGNILDGGNYDAANAPLSLYLEVPGVVGRFIRISRDINAAGNTGTPPNEVGDQIVLSVGELVAYGTLVPEPGIGLMLLAGGLLAMRRRA